MAELEPTPDGVPCRHCGKPIFWDEICWVHDNGFADCGAIISGDRQVGDGVVLDPDISVVGIHKGNRAEPVGEWA